MAIVRSQGRPVKPCNRGEIRQESRFLAGIFREIPISSRFWAKRAFEISTSLASPRRHGLNAELDLSRRDCYDEHSSELFAAGFQVILCLVIASRPEL
jgi:hypothetical protein